MEAMNEICKAEKEMVAKRRIDMEVKNEL